MIDLTLSQSSDESVSMFDEADDDDSLHEFGLRYVYCAMLKPKNAIPPPPPPPPTHTHTKTKLE